MAALEKILQSIARLAPSDQVELASQLLARLEREGRWPPRPGPGEDSVEVLLLFDGGSLGNPGPGYGSYILSLPDGREIHRRLDFGRPMTNNEAEYETLVSGLEEAHRLLGEGVSQTTLEVRGDSLLVCQQVQGRWKARDARMKALRDQVLELLRPFAAWRLLKVPRREVAGRLGH